MTGTLVAASSWPRRSASRLPARDGVERVQQAAAQLERAADTKFVANAQATQGLVHLVVGEVGSPREALGSGFARSLRPTGTGASSTTPPGRSVSSRP